MKDRLSQKQIDKILKIAGDVAKTNDLMHQESHVKKTLYYATLLAKKEGGDLQICQVAAILHDICKGSVNHAKDGAIKAAEILNELKIEKEFNKKVCYAVAMHMSFGVARSKEARILWDADKLQGIGPRGLMLLYTRHLLEGNDWRRAVQTARKEQQYYYEKFHTVTAKKIAAKLIKQSESFYNNLEKELNE